MENEFATSAGVFGWFWHECFGNIPPVSAKTRMSLETKKCSTCNLALFLTDVTNFSRSSWESNFSLSASELYAISERSQRAVSGRNSLFFLQFNRCWLSSWDTTNSMGFFGPKNSINNQPFELKLSGSTEDISNVNLTRLQRNWTSPAPVDRVVVGLTWPPQKILQSTNSMFKNLIQFSHPLAQRTLQANRTVNLSRRWSGVIRSWPSSRWIHWSSHLVCKTSMQTCNNFSYKRIHLDVILSLIGVCASK